MKTRRKWSIQTHRKCINKLTLVLIGKDLLLEALFKGHLGSRYIENTLSATVLVGG